MAWGATPIGLDRALAAGLYPFVIADALKVLLAASILPAVWRLIGSGDSVI
jgi:biotin transporter BioY